MAGVAVLVAVNLRRTAPAGAPPAPAPSGDSAPKQRIEGFEYRGYKGDRETYVLRAERYEGQEQDQLKLGGVDMDFNYVSRGSPGTGHIRSDEGTYAPGPQRAVFRGHVVLTTQDGLELTTESLIYRGDRSLARSDEYVEFRRKQLSGSSQGMEYHAEDGWLELHSEAFLRIEGDESHAATEIRGGRARVDRGDEEMRFADSVKVTRGRDTLIADRLVLGFSWDEQRVSRVQAVDKVRFDMAAGEALPGTTGPTAPRGPRVLECARLELSFRPDRSLERALAVGEARLSALPAAGEPAEKRTLWADALTFQFDEQERLERIVGQKGSGFDAEPLDPKAGEPRSVRCQTFTGHVAPETGEVRGIEFRQDVVFQQGTRQARSQRARYDGGERRLYLSQGEPRLADTAEGTQLTAKTIDLGTESGDITARGQVEHLLQAEGAARRGGLLGSGDGATQVSSRLFDYEAASRTAWYREKAVLKSGQDVVQAPDIRIREEGPGRRRLTASGGVVSKLHPRAAADQPEQAPVDARARDMTYEEASQQLVYSGDVTLTQQDVVTVSPVATLTLTPDGSGLLGLVAGEPVEVRQGNRTAAGTRVTYNPSSQSMVLVGEKVVLRDPGREVSGRSLTFHIGDDRVLIDGREEGRVETVFPRTPPKP
jgi:LPS export ABC transporter protein LptC/lipopolysaccharide transport protein LptA